MPRRRQIDTVALARLLELRQGVCRRSELERLGVAGSTISYRTRLNGPWQSMHSGVVLTCTGVPTREQTLMAAIVYAKGGAVITGLSALELDGFRSVPKAPTPHVLIPHRRNISSSEDIIIERTRRLPPHRSINRLPVAPTERAVIDAVRRLKNLHQVRAIMAEAVQRKRCTSGQLAAELREAQMRGTKLARAVLREVVAGIRSLAEAEARELLLAAGIAQPLWNHDVFDDDGTWLARPDGIWPQLGVVLEIDSIEWHLSPQSYRRSRARLRRLAKVGLIVVPISPSEYREDPDAFLAELRAALDTGATRPAPAVIVRRPREVAAA